MSGFGLVSLCDGSRVVGHFCDGVLHGPAIFHSDRGLRTGGSFWSGNEKDHGPAFVKSGLRFAGFYWRGVRNGLAFEINPSYSTFTYGTLDIAGTFTGVNISQVIQFYAYL